jgi:hypothetical protein
LVEDAIAEFGRQNGVCNQALTVYVADFLNGRVNIGDPTDPFYLLAEERLEDEEELEDGEELEGKEESKGDKDGDDESSNEDGEGESSDVEGVTVDEDGRVLPLYGRKSRILLGDK